MALDVIVKIDLTKPVPKLGFGIPLLLETGADADKTYTECKSLAEVKTAGFGEDTNTYKTAALLYANDDSLRIAVEATTKTATEWLGVVDNVSKSWRQLILTENNVNTAEEIKTVSPVVETLKNKVVFFSVTKDETLAGVTKSNIERTFIFFCSNPTNGGMAVGALVGATAGLDVGSFTYKNLILKGITPESLTDSEITAIHNKGGVTFVTKAGDNVTSEGKVLGGEYLDIIDSKDYVISQLEYQIQKLLNTSLKVPYDNNGIAMLESVAINVMKDAYEKGIIAIGEDGKPAYSVSFGKREDTDASDRVARRYVLGQFKFSLAGAIHEVEIKGEIII